VERSSSGAKGHVGIASRTFKGVPVPKKLKIGKVIGVVPSEWGKD
jgi:hypothetical protein